MTRTKLLNAYCLMAGMADFVSGILLIAMPAAALKLMLIAESPTELIYMRWIGIFVLATGAYYLLPYRHRTAARRREHQRAMLEMTAIVRGLIGIFVLVSIATNSLSVTWITVGIFDSLTAIFQVIVIRQKWLDT